MNFSNDFFDGFHAQFHTKQVTVRGTTLPSGSLAAQALEIKFDLLHQINQAIPIFKEEFLGFLTVRDAMSTGVAAEAMVKIWRLLMQLPVYDQFKEKNLHGRILNWFQAIREDTELMDQLCTKDSEMNLQMQAAFSKLEHLTRSIEIFQDSVRWMLEDFFEDLPSRQPEAYAAAYANFLSNIRAGELDEEAWGSTYYSLSQKILFDVPIQISFLPVKDFDTGRLTLAEQMRFTDLDSFLYMDLRKGLAAGNAPRKCRHCGKYFLAIGAYNTLYCDRVAPGEKEKTCRQVGAHVKEKEKIGTDRVQAEYKKVYNRLKTRKNRGMISVDQWNRQVAEIQDLKQLAYEHKITDAEYQRRLSEF